MNEVWRARCVIVARGCARGRVRSRRRGSGRRYVAAAGSAAGSALAARTDLPAGLPDRGRGLRVHRRRERPVHRGRAVDQAGQPGRPGPAARAVGPDRRPVPGAGREDDPGGPGPAGPASPDPGPARTASAQPPGTPRRPAPGQRARLPCPARRPAAESAGPGPVKGSGRRWQDFPRSPARRRYPGPPARRGRARRAPAGPPRGRRQAQRDQPLHRAPGTPGPGWCRGDLRRPPHRAGEPELAGR